MKIGHAVYIVGGVTQSGRIKYKWRSCRNTQHPLRPILDIMLPNTILLKIILSNIILTHE